MPIQCEIVTQERTVFSGQVDSVNLPGAEGRMGVLPRHSALLTILGFGEVMVRVEGEEEYFAIGGGIVEVQPERVVILADSAEHAAEIDVERAEQARQRAEKLMEEGVGHEDAERYAQIQASLQRAQVRLDVGRRRSGRRRRIPATGAFEEEREEQE